MEQLVKIGFTEDEASRIIELSDAEAQREAKFGELTERKRRNCIRRLAEAAEGKDRFARMMLHSLSKGGKARTKIPKPDDPRVAQAALRYGGRPTARASL